MGSKYQLFILVNFENLLTNSHAAKLVLTRQHCTPLFRMAQWKIEETPIKLKIPTDTSFKNRAIQKLFWGELDDSDYAGGVSAHCTNQCTEHTLSHLFEGDFN